MGKRRSYELHHFADASKFGYGNCTLTAALVSAKVGTKIREELCYPNFTEFFWADSKVVLGYIKNEAKRFHTFVANRLQEIKIRTKMEQWHYIDTKNNPADHASRGRTAEEFVKSNSSFAQ